MKPVGRFKKLGNIPGRLEDHEYRHVWEAPSLLSVVYLKDLHKQEVKTNISYKLMERFKVCPSVHKVS